MAGADAIQSVDPGRVLIGSKSRPKDVSKACSSARVVQFDEPLPGKVMDALRAALKDHPDVELYVYGHSGGGFQGDLGFLDGFEFLRHLSVNHFRVTSLERLHDFTELESLSVADTRVGLSIDPIANNESLQRLAIPVVKDPEVLTSLASLRELSMPGNQALLDSLRGHGRLQRLSLHFGSGRNFQALTTLPKLRDLLIWQIKGLATDHLTPIGETSSLESLALGAARNVDSLRPISGATNLRALELEKLPRIDSFEPLSRLSKLQGFAAFESRPADKDLTPVLQLPALEDLTVGDVYPKAQVEKVMQRGIRAQVRGCETNEPSRIRWRSMFGYIDSRRTDGAPA